MSVYAILPSHNGIAVVKDGEIMSPADILEVLHGHAILTKQVETLRERLAMTMNDQLVAAGNIAGHNGVALMLERSASETAEVLEETK